MLKETVRKEVARFQETGFEAVVSFDEVVVSEKEKTISLGADTAIISGIYFDGDTLTNDDRVFVCSASDALCGSSLRLAAMGENVHRTMKQFITIRRNNDSVPMVLNIVKICPKFK